MAADRVVPTIRGFDVTVIDLLDVACDRCGEAAVVADTPAALIWARGHLVDNHPELLEVLDG